MAKSRKSDSILRVERSSESEEDREQDADAMEQDDEEDQEQESGSQPNSENEEQDKPQIKKKLRKKGIIYIGSIPKHMNVTICRELMEQFGAVGRIFLQPDTSESKYEAKFMKLSLFIITTIALLFLSG
jgi:ESF2/ABP1 family protein